MQKGLERFNPIPFVENDATMEQSDGMRSPAQRIAEKIRHGLPIDDYEFDKLYPRYVRDLSALHWTPIQIAKKVATLAVPAPGTKVLDVGSGAGKFCIVGALTTEGYFVGLEQRQGLVDIADTLVSNMSISNVSFRNGNLESLDWADFDSIYLYNPFSENLDETIRIDHTVGLDWDLYIKYIRYTQAQLNGLRPGTRVITYNGFGGDFPPTYKRIHIEEINFITLEVWDKE